MTNSDIERAEHHEREAEKLLGAPALGKIAEAQAHATLALSLRQPRRIADRPVRVDARDLRAGDIVLDAVELDEIPHGRGSSWTGEPPTGEGRVIAAVLETLPHRIRVQYAPDSSGYPDIMEFSASVWSSMKDGTKRPDHGPVRNEDRLEFWSIPVWAILR